MKHLFHSLFISVALVALTACSDDETTKIVGGLTSTLSTVSAEPPGENCSQGGSRVDTGLDSNADNILQPSEIENTQYTCLSNTAPVAQDDQAVLFTGNGSVTIDVLANDQDLESSALTVSAVGSVANATVVINPDQTLTVSTALTSGTLSFDYTVTDGALTSTASVAVVITVGPEPVLSNLSVNLEKDVLTYDLLGSVICADCQSVQYTWSYLNDDSKAISLHNGERLTLETQDAVTGSLLTLTATGTNSGGFQSISTQQYRLEVPVIIGSSNEAHTRFTHSAPVTAVTPEGTFDRLGAVGETVFAFALVTEDGAVVTWGLSDYGGDSSGVADEINGTNADNTTPNKVTKLYSSARAIAALREDGSVVTWGNAGNGGDSSSVASELDGTIDVVEITGSRGAFAALREDGSVVTWGASNTGGNSSGVADEINGTNADNTTPNKVVRIFRNLYSFAALREDGSVVTWGNGVRGGSSSAVADEINGTSADNVTPNKVVNIFSTRETSSYAALREDGSVVFWGFGTGTTGVENKINGTNEDNTTINKVLTVFVNGHPNNAGMAALREDGSVVTWGDSVLGGDSDGVADKINGTNEDNVTSNKVISISGTSTSLGGAFAALREDGSVVTWGDSDHGGDSMAVATELDAANGSSRVVNIYSNPEGGKAFAALREDGSVITWGDPNNGGDSSTVAEQIRGANIAQNKVVKIFTSVAGFGATGNAFAALREDGSVVTWGNAQYGGDSSAVAHRINGTIPVTQVYANGGGFTAIREDNAVISWGLASYGGDTSTVDLAVRVVPLP